MTKLFLKKGTKKYEIEIFSLDTQQTILERIASKLNSLPKYIYFLGHKEIPSLNKLKSEKEFEIQDILEIIQNQKDIQPKFFKEIINKLNQQSLKLYEDILVIMVSFNKNLEDYEENFDKAFFDSYLFSIQNNLNESKIFMLFVFLLLLTFTRI